MSRIAILSLFSLVAISSASASISYNAATDFPTTVSHNPNGNWSYAYSDPNNLAHYTLYDTTNTTQFVNNGALSIYSTKNTNYATPLVSHTTGDNFLFMHPGEFNEYVIVLFKAPTAGTYSINGKWEGVDPSSATNGGNGTDVHVITGTSSLFDGISNYASPAVFNIPNVTLAAGQQVEFAMGFNTPNYYYDSTQFEAIITATPEPSLYVFTGLGLAGLGMFARRRRNA